MRCLGFAVAVTVGLASSAYAAEEVNLYSSRHYGNDQELFDLFTEKTGIVVNRIEGNGPALLERLKAEGEASLADVFMTVDAGMFWRAEEEGIFQPVRSTYLEERVPEHLRDPEGRWFGFSKRARVIYADAAALDALPATYEALADPAYRGKVCIRSSSNIYNLSLMASIIAAEAPGPPAWSRQIACWYPTASTVSSPASRS